MRSLVFLFCLLAPAAASAQAFIPMGARVQPPLGYTAMCQTDPALCQSFLPKTKASQPAEPTTLAALLAQPTAALTATPLPAETIAPPAAPPSLDQLARAINASVNRRVIQQTDQSLYGQAELWRPAGQQPGARGDCEDIALEKRLELLAAGFPADRLFMAIARHPTAGLHAVLVARLDSGDVVLDNRAPGLAPWANTAYDWLIAQSPQDPARWYAIPH